MGVSFLQNAWYAAAWASELTTKPLARRILDRPVVLFRGEGGAVGALDDCCPHRMAPLSLGVVEGDTLRCGYHGLQFDCSGTCVEIPGQRNIPPRANATAYPLVERWTLAWIWMGDAARADPGLIPECPWLTSPDWGFSHGTIAYDCNYILLIDNLLDLSHTTYTHRRTIGTDDVVLTGITAERRNGTVHIDRTMNDTEPSPMYKAAGGFTGNVDRWQRIAYEPPGNIVIDAGAVPAGTNDKSRGIDTRVISYLTPETETSVFQFWAFARDFAVDDPKMTAFIADQIQITFEEDKVVLDGQQRNVTARPGRRLLDNNNDAGVVLARKLLAERMAAEAA